MAAPGIKWDLFSPTWVTKIILGLTVPKCTLLSAYRSLNRKVYAVIVDNPKFWRGKKESFLSYSCNMSIRDQPRVLLIFSSVQLLNRVQLCVIPRTAHASPPCPSPNPGACSKSCPSSRWCHPTISSSVIPFSSCPQPFPASGSFQMSQLCASGGQSIGVSASASVLLMNTQDWSPLGWTGWISLQSKGLSRVFSNTTVQKHQFFSAQLSL